jgi:glycerophosphoryl diester phosphodiesterase
MTAMKRAVSVGADILEADARATSDDHMALMHDSTVDRTTNGTGSIRGKTSTQVKALLLDDGSPVPFVSTFLSYAHSTNKTVLLELKAMGGDASWTRTVNAIVKYGQDRVIIQSFNGSWLTKMHSLLPGVRLMLLTTTQVPAATARTYGGLIGEQSIMTDSYIATLAGIPTFVYTVDTSAGFIQFHKKVDAIITDDPAAYISYRSTACAA